MKCIIKSLHFVTLAVMIIGSFSCQKFLSKKNNDQLIVPTTLRDLQSLLDDQTIMNSGTPSFGETSATDYFLRPSTYASLSDGNLQFYTWRPYDYPGGDWHKPAQPVYNSNLCLQYLDNFKNTNAQEWKTIKGSALFFRSYYFLGLLWDYAKAWNEQSSATDPGIMLRTSADFNKLYQRSSVKDCYEMIIKDTRESVALLPVESAIATRPSKAAAYGLLGRTFWSMRNYKEAFLYTDSCLQLTSQLIDFNNDGEINITANTPFKPFNKETVFYSLMTNNGFSLCYPYAGLVDSTLYSSYDEDDLRKQAYFRLNNGYYQFKGAYVSDPVNRLFTGIATDEIYLIRAECFIRNGKLQEGIDDLNTLLESRWRSNKYIPVVVTDQESALNLVLNERRKELLFRGLRWIDIKRLNKEGRNIILTRAGGDKTYSLSPNDPYYALPLPEDLIKVTGIQQN